MKHEKSFQKNVLITWYIDRDDLTSITLFPHEMDKTFFSFFWKVKQESFVGYTSWKILDKKCRLGCLANTD